MTSIVWFRDDLRLADNPALSWAAKQGPLIALYLYDDATAGLRPLGGAQRWWLKQSLIALDMSLRDKGGQLTIAQGDPATIIVDLVAKTKASAVSWNRIYSEPAMERDTALKALLSARGLKVQTFNANLIHEPVKVKNQSGGNFKVFTPFWKAISAEHISPPVPIPELSFSATSLGMNISSLPLNPTPVDWATGWGRLHAPGEAGAHRQLESRYETIFNGYSDDRNLPGTEGTSRLSPHLRFGEISPRQVWHKTLAALESHGPQKGIERNAWAFLREIGWREFSHYLLYHFPLLGSQNWRSEFDQFPWQNNPAFIEAWQGAKTGYPIVDAGLRELWQTGWMHNRVRMIVASFLIKHLMVDWRVGEAWFWDTLIDACPANNTASWQWVAGSGADASPYFRIFNPITQSEKFDPNGSYVRRWVPELERLDDRLVHQPWEAPALVLHAAGIQLGQGYPHQIVDHHTARQTALDAYETIKKKSPAS